MQGKKKANFLLASIPQLLWLINTLARWISEFEKLEVRRNVEMEQEPISDKESKLIMLFKVLKHSTKSRGQRISSISTITTHH